VGLENKETGTLKPILLVNNTFSGFCKVSKGQEKIITEVSKRVFGIETRDLTKDTFEDWWIAINGIWKEEGQKLFGQSEEEIADIWCKGAFFGDMSVEFDAEFFPLSEEAGSRYVIQRTP
jgi:hypothetical protein